MMRARRREKGFTLLEVLVGITVFSLLVTTVYAGFRMGGRTWEAGEAKSDASNQMRLVSGFLRRSLSKAQPIVMVDGRNRRLQFEGSEEGIRFITEVPSYLGVGGLYEYTLATEGHGDESRLVFARRLFHPDVKEDSDEPEQRVLVEDLVKARFSYFGSERPRAPAQWRDRWEGAQQLPTLVRVETQSDAVGAWPELVVRLRVDGVRVQRVRAPDDSRLQSDGVTDDELDMEDEQDFEEELDIPEDEPRG